MTVENKLLIELADIVAVEYVCNACKTRLSMTPERWGQLPADCPHCNRIEGWFPRDDAAIKETTRMLLSAISRLNEIQERLKFSLRFEIRASANPASQG